FATRGEYQIAGDGWLHALSVSGAPASATASALLKPLQALLDYARIKADVAPDDARLLTALQDPVAATADANGLLYTLMRWAAPSPDALLPHSGKVNAGNADRAALRDLPTFVRVHDAFAVTRVMGISADALIAVTTNEPVSDSTRALQAALRARYEPGAWRD